MSDSHQPLSPVSSQHGPLARMRKNSGSLQSCRNVSAVAVCEMREGIQEAVAAGRFAVAIRARGDCRSEMVSNSDRPNYLI